MINNSNALPEDYSSPFYIANKIFCLDFDDYIKSKNGKTKGEFNAWAYTIYGKITTPKNWVIKYKKATYTTSGNLFISAEKQGLLILAEWRTKTNSDSNFIIRRKRTFDVLNPKVKDFEIYSDYKLISTTDKPLFFSNLIRILTPLFKDNKIFEVHLKNNELKIELRSKKHHFNILDELIEQIRR